MKPATRVKVGLRAALRRRYGYAALRVFRRALRAAMADHQRRQVAPALYDGTTEAKALRQMARAAMWRLLSRWPALSLSDERSEP